MAWVTQFIDGFDHYSTADILAKWTSNGTPQGGTQAIDTTVFRNSGRALKTSGASGSGVFKNIGQFSNYCIGFGFYINTIPPGATVTANSGELIFGLGEGLSFPLVGQVGLAILSDGKLHAVRAGTVNGSGFSSATDLGTGTTVFSPTTWYYIEARVFIDGSVGQFEVRVNGVSEINLTGINTKAQTWAYATDFGMGGGSGSQTINKWFDDFYLRTSSSSSVETGGFLGDVKIKPYYPNADGTYSGMTCSTGSTHNTLVKETSPNLTDYVSSSTALTKDSYGFQDASETGTIKAVQLSAYCYKLDAGFRGVDVFVKSGSTEVYAASQTLSTTPRYAIKVFDQDPNTSADWSQTNFNAAEWGVRISVDL